MFASNDSSHTMLYYSQYEVLLFRSGEAVY